MPQPALSDLLERIVLAGVGLTSRALTEATEGAELTFPQWRVLVVLGEDPADATLTAVASRIGVTLPATSRQLHRLQRRGLVEIERDPHDRRAARVRLTDAGRRVRSAIMGFRRDQIAHTAGSLAVSGHTIHDLGRIADALDAFR